MHAVRLAMAVSLFLSVSSVSTFTHAAQPFPEGQLLVRFAKAPDIARARSLVDSKQFEVVEPILPEIGIYLLKIKQRVSVHSAILMLSRNPEVIYSQPDHYVTERRTTPNDPHFASQWSLSGAGRAHVSASDAWDRGTGGKDARGNEIVVAIIDGGMDVNHPDLAPNLWRNEREIPGNRIDDDGNGYVDDVHGWNARASTGTIPTDAHGTAIAGIIGARGDNSAGIAGINWNVKLMPVAGSSGTTSVVARAYGYVIAQKKAWLQDPQKGANVVATNSSFGVDRANCESGEFPIWNDLYNEMGKAGILSAAATANLNINIDVVGDVPTGCSSPYLVTVTNTDRGDTLYPYAAVGQKVHLAAPGTQIFTTQPGGVYAAKDRFGYDITGTSFSTPHVAGAIGLMHSVASPAFANAMTSDPAKAALALKSMLLGSVDALPGLQGKIKTGGRLNVARATEAISRFE